MQKHQSFAKFQQKCNHFVYYALIATQKLGSGCYVTKIYATLKNITKSRCVQSIYNKKYYILILSLHGLRTIL